MQATKLKGVLYVNIYVYMWYLLLVRDQLSWLSSISVVYFRYIHTNTHTLWMLVQLFFLLLLLPTTTAIVLLANLTSMHIYISESIRIIQIQIHKRTQLNKFGNYHYFIVNPDIDNQTNWLTKLQRQVMATPNNTIIHVYIYIYKISTVNYIYIYIYGYSGYKL